MSVETKVSPDPEFRKRKSGFPIRDERSRPSRLCQRFWVLRYLLPHPLLALVRWSLADSDVRGSLLRTNWFGQRNTHRACVHV